MRRSAPALILSVFLAAASARAADSSEPKRRLGLGFTYGGGQVRFAVSRNWSMELRGLTGSAEAEGVGDAKSFVAGLRVYRHFQRGQRGGRLLPFAGAEAAYGGVKVEDSLADRNYDLSSFALGGFGGVEFYILSRLSLGVDIGPYWISNKEQRGSASGSGVDFVANSFLNFYFF